MIHYNTSTRDTKAGTLLGQWTSLDREHEHSKKGPGIAVQQPS